MHKKLVCWVVVLISMTIAVHAAEMKMVCGLRTHIVERLMLGYQEARVAFGLAENGDLIEVFVSENGSWTIAFTRPGGFMCLMVVGVYWTQEETSESDGT